MSRTHASAGKRVFGGAIFAGAMAVCFLVNQPLFAGPGRPIIQNGTVKTADGQRLRGMALVYAARESQTVKDWALNINTMRTARDQAHYNAFRLCEVDMRYGAQGVVTGAFPFIDSVVSNCGQLGMYLIIDYHSTPIWDESEWDLRHFWDVIAPRYKDVPWVMYEMNNEPTGDSPRDTTQAAMGNWVKETYVNHMRKWAPNTMILQWSCTCFDDSWAAFLLKFNKALGFSWNSGRDAFAYHGYCGTSAQNILELRTVGVPCINTESGYVEDGWGPSTLGGCARQMEWLEKNDESWCDWVGGQNESWFSPNPTNKAIKYLIPDALAKNYAWWLNNTNVLPDAAIHTRSAAMRHSDSRLFNISGQTVRSEARRDARAVVPIIDNAGRSAGILVVR